MIDTQRLRQKIIDIAIRGKLVPQNPTDEPASVLLERIRAEKEQMVKDGTLKPKDIKGDSVIYRGDDNLHYEKVGDGKPVCIEDQLSFDLPEGWSWSRASALMEKIGAGSTPRGGLKVYKTDGIKFIRSQNVYNDGLRLSDVAFIDKATNQAKAGSIVRPKDLLLNITGGSIGRCACVSDSFDIANVNQHVMILRLVETGIRNHVHLVITSAYLQKEILDRQLGSGRGGLSAETFSTFLIPIPPLAEQQRIVDALDTYLAFVGDIERDQSELDELLAKTRSKVLDLAIRGKLVPQNPNDEPASVLLERVHAEKLQMVKDGKLKKKDVAGDSVIFRGEDNSYYEKVGSISQSMDSGLPFELPDSWAWCRLRTYCLPQSKREPRDGLFCYIDIDSIDNKRHRIRNPKHLSSDEAPSRAQRAVYIGSTVFSMVRPYLENIAFVDQRDESCIASTGFYVCTPVESQSARMLFLTLLSPYAVDSINASMKGDNSPSVRKEDMESLLIPIPPLKEQEFIARCLDNLLLCLESQCV